MIASILRIAMIPLIISAASASDKAPYTASFQATLIDDGKDLIFPSIIRATDYFETPLSEYYLYSSPHAGADVRLYLADSITGPWRLHRTVVDKLVARSGHVSSPHAVWNEKADALFLYVHAPNTQTIYCHSKDGIHFEYGGVCVTNKMIDEVVDFKSKSASYARVYQYRIPEYANNWTMTLTASGGTNDQGLQNNATILCTSDDGTQWTVRRSIIDDGNGGQTYKSLDACWIPIDGRNYMVYALRSRTDKEEPVRLHLSQGDANWRNWKPRGVFYEPSPAYPDHGAARGLSLLPNSKEPFLVYEAGQKSSARIGLLKLDKETIANFRD